MDARSKGSPAGPTIMQEVLIYAVSAMFSFAILTFGLRRLDPNRANQKQATERKKEIAARLGRPCIQTNAYEDVIALDVVNPDQIHVSFDSIGGMQKVKQALDELVILPLKRPELFQRGNLLKPVKGVLLYGPPGTGKTMLAKALAKESQACFINVRVSTLQSKWFGDAQKLVTAVFTLAWKLQPSIIFIDEVDSFLGQRKSQEHEAVTNMKTEFMSLWDGFLTEESARVMVLAATNRPWEVDEAILRRLPQTFEVPLPDAAQRMSILDVLLTNEPLAEGFRARHPSSPLTKLAILTEGYSGSDLQELCKHAAYRPIRDMLEAERLTEGVTRASQLDPLAPRATPVLRHLTFQDFQEAVKERKPPSQAAFNYMHKDLARKAATSRLNSAAASSSASTLPTEAGIETGESDALDMNQLQHILSMLFPGATAAPPPAPHIPAAANTQAEKLLQLLKAHVEDVPAAGEGGHVPDAQQRLDALLSQLQKAASPSTSGPNNLD